MLLVKNKKNLGQIYKGLYNFLPKNCHLALKNIGLGYGIRYPVSRKTYSGSRIRNAAILWPEVPGKVGLQLVGGSADADIKAVN